MSWENTDIFANLKNVENSYIFNGKNLNDIKGIQLPYAHRDYYNVFWMYGVVINKKYGKKRTSHSEDNRRNG